MGLANGAAARVRGVYADLLLEHPVRFHGCPFGRLRAGSLRNRPHEMGPREGWKGRSRGPNL